MDVEWDIRRAADTPARFILINTLYVQRMEKVIWLPDMSDVHIILYIRH